jgi:NNP family nitrate/nitrite transporter-like MFS transporter
MTNSNKNKVEANSPEVTNIEKIRGLPWSIAFNAGNAIYIQLTFFGSVMVLFLSELNFNKTEIGSTLSLLYLTGIFAVFIAPYTARLGYKRTFLTFMTARAVITAFLLLTPFVLSKFGQDVVLWYVVLISGLFALSRTIALTGWMPWAQEYIPNSLRGKFSALSNIFTNLSGFLAVLAAGWALQENSSLNTYMVLFAVGLFFAATSIWAATNIPGGAPRPEAKQKARFSSIRPVFRDRGYLLFLLGVGLVTLGVGPLGSFLPLYLRDKVGLSTGSAVYIQAASILGGILAGYIWGWAADRYGSKPIMLWGLLIRAMTPLFWFIMPRAHILSLILSLIISFVNGAAAIGWTIGSSRLLYNSVVPIEQSSNYMSLWNTWGGITWGLSQVAGGWILDAAGGISGQIWVFPVDSYTALFAIALALPFISSIVLNRIQAEKSISIGQFASLFLHGNPLMAFNSLLRFQLARDERTTVTVTERLGQSKSPLTVEELLEALADPRFNVRFEAIISIARRDPDPRLTQALCKVLEYGEPALGVVAAWALGRIGDEKALKTLRATLTAPYRSIQAHSARSLGTLQDAGVAPLLMDRLANETDIGLKIAFTSALGKLKAVNAIPYILPLLKRTDDQFLRNEIALALARIIDNEHRFIQILRNVRADPGTAAAQILTDSEKSLVNLLSKESATVLEHCTKTFAREEIKAGITQLVGFINLIPLDAFPPAHRQILENCISNLKVSSDKHLDYLILALLVLSSRSS